jgi:hypothetical protein
MRSPRHATPSQRRGSNRRAIAILRRRAARGRRGRTTAQRRHTARTRGCARPVYLLPDAREASMLRTRVCDLLGIRFPVFAAPLGPTISGPELTAAVSGAGALGIMSWGARPPELLRQAIRRVRALSAAPFGVNVIVPLGQDAQIAVCLEERVPVLSLISSSAWRRPSVRARRRSRRAEHSGMDFETSSRTERRRRYRGQVRAVKQHAPRTGKDRAHRSRPPDPHTKRASHRNIARYLQRRPGRRAAARERFATRGTSLRPPASGLADRHDHRRPRGHAQLGA